MFTREGKNKALESQRTSKEFYVDGSEDHYQYFQGLFNGNLDITVDKYGEIFSAQVLLGICGSGHLDYRFGIPERISPGVSTYVFISRAQDDPVEHDVADCVYHYICLRLL